jgi:hypothetical protein
MHQLQLVAAHAGGCNNNLVVLLSTTHRESGRLSACMHAVSLASCNLCCYVQSNYDTTWDTGVMQLLSRLSAKLHQRQPLVAHAGQCEKSSLADS